MRMPENPAATTVERVARCVTEILGLEPGAAQPGSRLMEDLGADSLDLVELMYVLEQEFGVILGKEDVSISAQLGLPEEEIHQHEVLTPAALERLRERFPWAGAMFVPGLTRKHLAALLTVEEVARAVDRKLGAGG
jgi:acyl carrier protein